MSLITKVENSNWMVLKIVWKLLQVHLLYKHSQVIIQVNFPMYSTFHYLIVFHFVVKSKKGKNHRGAKSENKPGYSH